MKKVEFVCLMKHDVSVMMGGEVRRLPASGMVAEVEDRFTPVETPSTLEGLGVDVVRRARAGDVVLRDSAGQVVRRGLPEPQPGVVLLVNGAVRDALEGCGRNDVFAPDTGATAERNSAGHVLFVRRLVAPNP